MRRLDGCRSRNEFAELSRARRRNSSHCWMRFAPDPAVARPRVAFAVGRRFGKAVVRNRVRRQLRAALNQLAPEMPHGRYLVGLRAGQPPVAFDALVDQLRQLIGSFGVARPAVDGGRTE